MAIWEFYSPLRVTNIEAKLVGLMLINEQTLTSIMPANDWRQLKVNRPAWMREQIELAFERFVEQTWKKP